MQTKKPLPALILTLFLACAGVGTAIWFFLPASGVTLVLTEELGSPSVRQAVVDELANFHTLYPGLQILTSSSSSQQGDLAIVTQYPADPKAWLGTPVPWSGTLWVLAARKEGLSRLAAEDPALASLLSKGNLTPEAFESALVRAKSWGPAPLTLGNSHGWPYLLWLQAWTAATLGPEAAMAAPATALAQPLATLNHWRLQGFFEASAWPQGWVQGLAPLAAGSATFALLSEPLLTALPPAARAQLEFLPLPKRAADPFWSLGRAQWLVVSAASKHLEEAKLVLQYLSSPGVTQRLTQVTGRPFFAWNAATGKAPLVVPDWAARITDPAVAQLAKQISTDQ